MKAKLAEVSAVTAGSVPGTKVLALRRLATMAGRPGLEAAIEAIFEKRGMGPDLAADRVRLELRSGRARERREAAGMPVSDAAYCCDVTVGMVKAWEAGRVVPGHDGASAYGFVLDIAEGRIP